MSVESSSAIFRFVDRVRQDPSRAVAPEELAELERNAREDLDGARIAVTSPMANRTEYSKKFLSAANSQAVTDDFNDLGEPCRIVGFNPVLLATEANKVLPPLNAVECQITIGRAEKEVLTDARNVPADAPANGIPSQNSFVPLSGLDAAIGNRILDYRLFERPYAIEFQYQWAVDQSIRTALGWSSVIVQVSMFMQLKYGVTGRRRR